MMQRIFVAGHRGMVGSAVVRLLKLNANVEIITRTHADLNLINQADVNAAKVGGIHANDTYPADFIYDNLMIQSNVIESAYRNGVIKLLLLGSSCIYPRLANQPMNEGSLLTSSLEPTNEPYAIAKIAGIKLCESYNRQYGVDYRSVMPTNLYGENDNFHPENSHVIPAMLRRFHQAKINGDQEVLVWGSGKPMREFLYVDDMASACLHLMNLSPESYREAVDERLSHINIGTGVDCTIRELAETISRVVEYQGAIKYDSSKPDGAPRKLLDVSRLSALGWQASISLEQGLSLTYQWFLKNEQKLRGV